MSSIKKGDVIEIPEGFIGNMNPLGQRMGPYTVHAVCEPFVVTEDGWCFSINQVTVLSPEDIEMAELTGRLSDLARTVSIRKVAENATLDELQHLVRILSAYEDEPAKRAIAG